MLKETEAELEQERERNQDQRMQLRNMQTRLTACKKQASSSHLQLKISIYLSIDR